jgi:AraC family transcriptional regulator, transcriptional activator of pobA
MKTIPHVASITELHSIIGKSKPRHPLITFLPLDIYSQDHIPTGITVSLGFYSIFWKTFDGVMKYGRGHYDFAAGSLIFLAPNQVTTTAPDPQLSEGWVLHFHPDLLHGSALESKIDSYSFFDYATDEALHVSDDERSTVLDCIQKIEKEYNQNIDQHTQELIVANLDLLLGYCKRFYNRQFLTRQKVNSGILQRFERLLKDYFKQEDLLQLGMPSVDYFADKMNLSANYLSDLLTRLTGKSTQQYIHLQLVERAKSLLWDTDKSVSEIAYGLGFEYPSHFTKLFKNKTGKSPREFRALN